MKRIAVVVAMALAACGGGDSNEPEPAFPDVAGAYTMHGTFDDIPTNQGFFDGTVTLTQQSREAPALAGTLNVTAHIGDEVFNLASQLFNANVSADGLLTFTAGDGSATWTFTGQRASSGAISGGRHTLGDGTDSFSGDWTATVAGASVESAVRLVPLRTLVSALQR